MAQRRTRSLLLLVAIVAAGMFWHLGDDAWFWVSTTPGHARELSPPPAGPPPIDWEVRVRRWGKYAGEPEGPVSGFLPGGSIDGAYRRGAPVGVWAARTSEGEWIWSGLAYPDPAESAGSISLDGVSVEWGASNQGAAQWRPRGRSDWVPWELDWGRDWASLVAVRREGRGLLRLGTARLDGSGSLTFISPTQFLYRSDGSLESVFLEGRLETRFDENGEIREQVVIEPDGSITTRTEPPWVDF